MAEGGIGVSKRVLNGYDRGWVRVPSARDAGRNAAVGYRLTGDLLPGGSVSWCLLCAPRRVSLKRGSLSGVALHRTYLGSTERGERNATIQIANKLARALDTILAGLFLELEKGADPREER